MRPGGTIALIGVLSGPAMDDVAGPIVTRQVRLQGVTVGHRERLRGDAAGDRAASKIEPVIDRSFGFDELKEGHDLSEERAQFGKVVIEH